MEPNLVIFRANSLTPKFVELSYLGNLLSKTGDIITCSGTYNCLTLDEIVLSRITQTGSTELGRFNIRSDNGAQNIFELAYAELAELITHLVQVIKPPTN